MSLRFVTGWSEALENDGSFSERDWAYFWADMKHLLENTSRSAHPRTVVQAFERFELHYKVPANLAEAAKMYLLRKATFEGCVPVIRYLLERWNCPLPLEEEPWRRVSLPLKWSEHQEQQDLLLEWSTARENLLLRQKHLAVMSRPTSNTPAL
jgi:hypothetical protein